MVNLSESPRARAPSAAGDCLHAAGPATAGGTTTGMPPAQRFAGGLRPSSSSPLPRSLARSLTLTLSLALALVTAACSTTGGGDDAAGSVTPITAVRSPAAERVIGGIADVVLTDRPWPSFDEARQNRVAKAADGSELFAHIRSERPLGEIAHPADPGGSFAFSAYPHLFLQIGDNESLRILATCYVTLTPAEARLRELVVPLAPLTYRPGQIPADCWLSTVATSKPGRRTWEVRLAGFPGRFERWLPVPDLLSIASVETELAAGAAGYSAMLGASPRRTAASGPAGDGDAGVISTPIRGSSLVAASPLLPGPRQDIGNSRIELQLQTLAAAALGRPPSEAYFVDREWTGITDARGRVTQQQAFAAALFKGDICSWQRLKVTRRPGATTLNDVEPAGDPIEVNCSDLP